MEATIRERRLATGEGTLAGNFAEREAMTTSARFVANNLLSELPGIAFGLITLVYIVSSLIALR
jgi:ABC-type phosphate transport system permease subunit